MAKDVRLTVVLSSRDANQIRREAKEAGIGVSTYLRALVLQAYKEEVPMEVAIEGVHQSLSNVYEAFRRLQREAGHEPVRVRAFAVSQDYRP